MTESEIVFAKRAIRRKQLYLTLSILSVILGVGLGVFYTWQAVTQTGTPSSIHFVVVILILLADRQNLRQFRYANILEKLLQEGK
jgi:hypothetical protein